MTPSQTEHDRIHRGTLSASQKHQTLFGSMQVDSSLHMFSFARTSGSFPDKLVFHKNRKPRNFKLCKCKTTEVRFVTGINRGVVSCVRFKQKHFNFAQHTLITGAYGTERAQRFTTWFLKFIPNPCTRFTNAFLNNTQQSTYNL